MNTAWIDTKYAGLVSSRLELYKVKKTNPYMANFRCPICGDSEKNKFKARGYLYQNKGNMYYKCHNCGIACTFPSFIKRLDPILYEEYSVEAFINKEKAPERPSITNLNPPKFLASGAPLSKLKKISNLPSYHPAKKYIVSRKIDTPWHARLFFCERFGEWTNSMIPDKLELKNEHSRIIIPFLKEDGTMFGYQGRSLDPKSKMRYITIMLEDRPKIFGLDLVNKKERVYVFEGPFDSMFINNSIAMAGADIHLDSSFIDPVYIFDNEPRNKEIVKRIDTFIDKGYNVVIWDNTFKGKDINDMILNGANAEHIKIVIDKRTFNGLSAKVELMNWKKV